MVTIPAQNPLLAFTTQPMVRYLAARLVRMIFSLVAVSIITFVLLQMAPGNFADIQRVTSGASELSPAQASEVIGEFQTRYGDDVPAWKQYLKFMKGAIVWDFGPSYKYPNLTVQEIIADAFPVSATLALISVAIAVVIAIPLGVLAAVNHNRSADYIPMFLLTISRAIPSYLIALFLILLFSRQLGWLPTRGWPGLKESIMPVAALSVGSIAILARYIRSSMLETLRQDYIMAARAKGGGFRPVVFGHALRNSLIPFVTIVGPYLAGLMTGTVFIESIFGIPGLGLYFADAARSRDMPLLMGSTLFFALILMTMNLFVDLIYRMLDPRIGFETSGRR
ncbi:MAG TPA: ABC transporter permease [Thermomicrobiales bacterium]|nr:ABC transporter permease [Thermomicrobiales bacterium]